MKPISAITVPRWGMTMTEGTICDWMVGEGDLVTPGQELIEIETTKITNVVESPAQGTLRRIVLAKGITAPVGALAGVIANDGVAEEEIDAFVASYADRMGEQGEDTDVPPVPRTISIDGRNVNFLDTGMAGKETVIFLHGFGGDLTTWLFNQSAISEKIRTVAFDLPGHGGSDPANGEDAFAAITETIAKAIEAIAPGRIHLVGHSFGGGIAATLAAGMPDKIASLSLIAPIGLGTAVNTAFLSDFIAAERRKPLQGVLERLFADPSKITSDMIEGVLRFKRLEGVPEALGRVAQSIADGNGQRQSIIGAIGGKSFPVLVIWGSEDAILPVPDAASLPAGVVFRAISSVGHMPQMEAAGDVNAALTKNMGLDR